MIPVRGATGARGCCARCWGSRGCPARRRQHRPRRPRNCVAAGGRTRPRGMPGCTTAMAAGPWAARGGPGRGRLAQLHRGAMGAHEWFLRPWLRLCARGGRCAHPAGDAHPLGHSETAGCLPPGSPPAGATAARVTRQCRCAQGAGGRGQGAGGRGQVRGWTAPPGSHRPAPIPLGPRAQAVLPVIGGLWAWRCPGGRRSPGPVHGRPCGHGILIVKNALVAGECCADCYVLRSACPPVQLAEQRAVGPAWPTATARAHRTGTAPAPCGWHADLGGRTVRQRAHGASLGRPADGPGARTVRDRPCGPQRLS